MKREPYLIQRLKKPTNNAAINPFSFGGAGLVNGGFNKEALKLLNPIFSFDYMGAAEFEWGAVPESLKRIFDRKEEYIGLKIDLMYVICINQDDYVIELTKHIKGFASGKQLSKTKEYVGADLQNDICGWLDIDNDYFFFTDKKMFNSISHLFGIKNKLK